MLNRYNALALRQPLGATVSFSGLLIVIAVVVQGFLRGWDRYLDHLGGFIAAALGAGIPMYFALRRGREAERS